MVQLQRKMEELSIAQQPTDIRPQLGEILAAIRALPQLPDPDPANELRPRFDKFVVGKCYVASRALIKYR